jgi:hypothetical protein
MKTHPRRWKQIFLVVIALSLIASSAYSLPYIHFIANAQRGFDRMEDQLQEKVIEVDPVGKRVVDLDRTWFTEQPFQRTRLFKEKGRPDLKWIGAGELLHGFSKEQQQLYGNDTPPDLTLHPLNKGDLLLSQGSRYPFRIALRGIGNAKVELPDLDRKKTRAEQLTGYRFREIFRLKKSEKVFSPLTFQPEELVFEGVLYEATEKLPARYRWEGHYGDFTQKEARFKLFVQPGHPLGILRISVPASPKLMDSVLPLRVTLTGEEGLKKQVVLEKSCLVHQINISELLKKNEGEIKIAVSKTWRPCDIGLGDDGRALGVMAEYVAVSTSKGTDKGF